MKIHVLLMSLLSTTAGIMYAAEVAPGPQPDFYQQQPDAVRQEIAQMIPNDDDLDKLALAYPNDPILLQEQHNRFDLLQYWTRPNIKSRSKNTIPGFSPAFSPDGNYLAYTSIIGGNLILLFVPTGYAIPIPKELERDWVRDFAFSPDTNMLAVIVNGNVKLWDLRTNRINPLDPLCGKGENTATSVAFSPEGTLAVGYEPAVIRLWNVENHIILQPPFHVEKTTENLRAEKLAFSHDGNLLAATFATPSNQPYEPRGTIIWNVANRTVIKHLPVVWKIKFAAKAGIFATHDGYDVLALWSFKNGADPIELWEHKLYLGDMALTPDGKVLATAHDDGKIRLWNTQNGSLLTTLNVGTREFHMAFSPNGKTLAIVDFETGEVRLFYKEK